MQQLPKEFMGRMVRTVLFIGLVAACCAGVATFGMFVASKFNLLLLLRSKEKRY